MSGIHKALLWSVVVAVFAIATLTTPAAPVQAAGCHDLSKASWVSWNPAPYYGYNSLNWTNGAVGANSKQVYVVERSTDGGATFPTVVQQSTAKSFIASGYQGDNVRFRARSVSSSGFACSPDGSAIVADPTAGFTNTTILP